MTTARVAFEAVLASGGEAAQQRACLAGLRRKDREIHDACLGLIDAGNPERVIVLLERHGGLPAPADEELAAVPGEGGAKGAALFSLALWVAIAAALWGLRPPLAVGIGALIAGWAGTLLALSQGAARAKTIDARYSTLDHLGALVFLAVLVPIGVVWTLARAWMVNAGRIDGTAHGPQPGGGHSSFEEGQIGSAGRPLALALLAVALGYPAALSALVLPAAGLV